MFFSFFKKAVNLELNLVYYSYLRLYFLHYLCKGCKEERGLCCPLHAACTAPVLVERDDSGRSLLLLVCRRLPYLPPLPFLKACLEKACFDPFPGPEASLNQRGCAISFHTLQFFCTKAPNVCLFYVQLLLGVLLAQSPPQSAVNEWIILLLNNGKERGSSCLNLANVLASLFTYVPNISMPLR